MFSTQHSFGCAVGHMLRKSSIAQGLDVNPAPAPETYFDRERPFVVFVCVCMMVQYEYISQLTAVYGIRDKCEQTLLRPLTVENDLRLLGVR